MATVKNGLKDLTTGQLLEKSRYIISQIIKNVTPPSQLAQVIIATDELEAANLAACARGSQAFVIKREKQAVLLHQLRQLAAWVQMASAHSSVFIVQCGFEVRKGNTRLGIAPAPTGAKTILSRGKGTLLLRWKPVHGKQIYGIDINAGEALDESQWKFAGFSTKTRIKLEGLESNRKYWVRVRTVSTAGASPAGEPVQGMVW